MTYILEALRVVFLEPAAQRRIADDRRAFAAGILFVAGEGVAMVGGLRAAVSKPMLWVAIPSVLILLSFLVVGVVHVVTTLLGGTSRFLNLYRPLSLSSIMGWLRVLSFFPLFAWLAGAINIWRILVIYSVLRHVSRLSVGRALFVVALVSIIGTAVLSLILIAWHRGHAGFPLEDLGAEIYGGAHDAA